MAIRMASPTTTSAAATTMTKKATTCPSRFPCSRAKETNARLHAFSMSSMLMNTRIALRRMSTPIAPMANRMTARNPYAAGLTAAPPARLQTKARSESRRFRYSKADGRSFGVPSESPGLDLPFRLDPLQFGEVSGHVALRVAAQLHVAPYDRVRYRTVGGCTVRQHGRHVDGVVQRVHPG